MRYLTRILLATASLPVAISTASGADMLFSPTRAHDWSGIYAGVQAGYGSGSSDAYELLWPSGAYVDGPLGYTADGFVGGMHLGRNAVVGSIVYGVETDIEFANIDGVWDWQNGNTLEKRIEWAGSLRARVGFSAGRALLYGTGGVAFASVEMQASSFGSPILSQSDTTIGWTLGAGAEFALDDRWSIRSEYRYTDYGETSVAGFAYGLNEEFTHSNKVHTVRFGVSRKF